MRDKKKIYIVISEIQEECDYVISKNEIAFDTLEEANKHIEKLEREEAALRELARRCLDCDEHNEDCPLYVPSSYENECGSYNPWRANVTYTIEEVDYEKTEQNNS